MKEEERQLLQSWCTVLDAEELSFKISSKDILSQDKQTIQHYIGAMVRYEASYFILIFD